MKLQMRKKQQKKINRKLQSKDLRENSIFIENLYVETKITIRTRFS